MPQRPYECKVSVANRADSWLLVLEERSDDLLFRAKRGDFASSRCTLVVQELLACQLAVKPAGLSRLLELQRSAVRALVRRLP